MSERTLDHIGIAVASLDRALPVWEYLTGAKGSGRQVVESAGVEVVFVGAGPGRIELLAPTGPDSPVARFLQRRGEGMHHVCYRVPDITVALAAFRDEGFEPIDVEPRRGANSHLIAFLHPRTSTGVLVEVLQSQ